MVPFLHYPTISNNFETTSSIVKSEVSISKKRFTTIKHFVYDTLIDLPNSKFVLMIDEETKIITPAVYTKRNGRVSMITLLSELVH